jgi:hypothetical protein
LFLIDYTSIMATAKITKRCCNRCDSSIFHEMALSSGWKAPGWGRKRVKTQYVSPTADHLGPVFGSRYGAQPTFKPAWTNSAAFADWKQRTKSDYVWAQGPETDLDGDDIPEGLVKDGSGRIMGINGYSVNKPSTWAKNSRWQDPDGGTGRYEYVYKQRKAYNDTDAVDTLAGLRKRFYARVIEPMYQSVQKGHPSRRVPRISIASYVINQMGGYAIDEEFIARYGEQIKAAGGSPESALAQYHRTKDYRTLLVQRVLDPVVNNTDGALAAAAEHASQYVASWLDAHPAPE